MDLYHYKASSEATDEDERALIPGFKRRPEETRDESDAFLQHLRAQRDAWDETEEHRRDLEHESRETEERETSGYWDCNENESTTD